MNVLFFINGRFFKTLCKTVLNAESFSVSFSTEKHTVTANISDKCFFTSIDNKNLDSLKTDFYFKRNYKNIKEFTAKLEDCFSSFINNSITDRHFHGNIDECISKILDDIKDSERETATDLERAETEDTTEKELENLEKELVEPEDNHIEVIKKFKEKADLNSYYGEATEPLTAYQFERLTGTLLKSLFKAIGLEETKKIPFIISNNMVFFNYNGVQYKYYPSQCKIFKKCERKYQRINWKNFADDNSPTGQKQDQGRSPPLLLI